MEAGQVGTRPGLRLHNRLVCAHVGHALGERELGANLRTPDVFYRDCANRLGRLVAPEVRLLGRAGVPVGTAVLPGRPRRCRRWTAPGEDCIWSDVALVRTQRSASHRSLRLVASPLLVLVARCPHHGRLGRPLQHRCGRHCPESDRQMRYNADGRSTSFGKWCKNTRS